MADAFTAKNYQIRNAPKRIDLLGDKTKRPEPAQHIIEFPGGAVEVSRTTEGSYWAHILIHRGQPIDEAQGFQSVQGQVVDSRIGRSYPGGVSGIEHEGEVEQIAVLISPAAKCQPTGVAQPRMSRVRGRARANGPDVVPSEESQNSDEWNAERGLEP